MFSLSTCWFDGHRKDGNAMVDEALEMGFTALELGYAATAADAEAVIARAGRGDIAVTSVHAFCPAPPDRPGHPELYSPSDSDEAARREAVAKVLETLELARRAGAGAVVLHAGRIKAAAGKWMWVHDRIVSDAADGFWYRFNLGRMVKAREAGIAAAMESLRRSLAELLPAFESAGVRLAIENLPSYDAMPSPDEADILVDEFGSSPAFSLWYDMGHGQVMENAGYGSGAGYARKHFRHLAGTHIHDVIGPAGDHQAPGQGGIDFAAFKFLAELPCRVFEPLSTVPRAELAASREMLAHLWGNEAK